MSNAVLSGHTYTTKFTVIEALKSASTSSPSCVTHPTPPTSYTCPPSPAICRVFPTCHLAPHRMMTPKIQSKIFTMQFNYTYAQ